MEATAEDTSLQDHRSLEWMGEYMISTEELKTAVKELQWSIITDDNKAVSISSKTENNNDETDGEIDCRVSDHVPLIDIAQSDDDHQERHSTWDCDQYYHDTGRELSQSAKKRKVKEKQQRLWQHNTQLVNEDRSGKHEHQHEHQHHHHEDQNVFHSISQIKKSSDFEDKQSRHNDTDDCSQTIENNGITEHSAQLREHNLDITIHSISGSPTASTVDMKQQDTRRLNLPSQDITVHSISGSPTASTVDMKQQDTRRLNLPSQDITVHSISGSPTASTVDMKQQETRRLNLPSQDANLKILPNGIGHYNNKNSKMIQFENSKPSLQNPSIFATNSILNSSSCNKPMVNSSETVIKFPPIYIPTKFPNIPMKSPNIFPDFPVKFGGTTSHSYIEAKVQRHKRFVVNTSTKQRSLNPRLNVIQPARNDMYNGGLNATQPGAQNLLQVSPSTGGALSYSIAMSRARSRLSDHNSNTGEQNITKLPIHFRHRPINRMSARSNKIIDAKPANSLLPNISIKDKQLHSDEEEIPSIDEDTIVDDKLKRKQLQTNAAIIEIEEQKATDNSYLIRYDVDDKMKGLIHKLRDRVIDSLDHITDDIRNEYDQFSTDHDQITYYNLRQAEQVLRGGYTPRNVVLISSSIPKYEILSNACKPEVLRLIYDVSTETYPTIIGKLKELLNTYMKGAKIICLAIICKGGPGYMYILKKHPITPPKLLKEKELLRFWKDLGSCMSKISSEPSVIQLMESNVTGNKQGEMLVLDLEAAMYVHKVKVESPLEISKRGNEMIRTYFVPEKFKQWKLNRYIDD